MKKLLLILCLFITFPCLTKDFKEITYINKQFQGSWILEEMSFDQGNTYYEPKQNVSFKILQATITVGDDKILAVSNVFETTENGIYFNVIQFSNHDELFVITKRKNQCMIAIIAQPNQNETARVILTKQKQINI